MQKNLLLVRNGFRKKSFSLIKSQRCLVVFIVCFLLFQSQHIFAQTLAFPGAMGFGKYAKGARGAATQEVYIVTNLNDSGPGSFRDAVSKQGRIVVFAVGGIVRLNTDIVVSPNVTIAGQTAPGDGIVFFNKRVTFTSASNTIARYLRIRLGATNNSGNDASGLASGSDMIFDHMSFSWGMDEVFSINWDGKGVAPDNITVQNSIIGQGLHRENHSAGGLIQTPDGGKVSLLQNLYISNKTRNPKVKGVNEFVNNVVYNWGNGNRLADNLNYGWSGDAYIMGGSSGTSEVNIINNYFVGGPLTPPDKTTPFSRGTGTFNVYGAGNYFDNNRNGALDGTVVPFDETGYPGITGDAFKTQPFAYPTSNPVMTAAQAYQKVIDSAGASYPRRDEVDNLMINEVKSYGTAGMYVYRESDLPLANGGLGNVFNSAAPTDSDADGMPDVWEDAHGLNKNDKADAVAYSTAFPQYLNIEVYINSLIATVAPDFIKSPTNITLNTSSVETPPSSSIIINWTDNSSNETGFELGRSTDGINYTVIASSLAANTTTYTDNDLVPNTTYYYRIKAFNTTDASAYSTASVKTPQIPSAPAVASSPTPANGFQYQDITGYQTILKWTGSSNTTTYAVYFGTDPSNLVKKTDVAYTATPSYTVTGLSYNTTYYWRVDAVNSKGTAEGTVWSFRSISVLPAGMVGHYAFDETAADGTKITDSTTYANNGVLGLDDDNQNIRVTGKVKNALDFATASTNMYVVSIPNKDQNYFDKGSFSLSFWMKAPASLLPPDNNTSSYLLCKGSITRNATTGATGKRFDIEFKNKQLRFAIDDDVAKDELQTDGTPFFSGEWVHVVAIRDSLNRKLQVYLNGSMVKEIAITNALTGIGEASSLVIGNIGELEFLATTNAPAPYKGSLDELKIFNYALTPQQVLQQYHTSPLPIQAYTPSPANAGQTDDAVKATVSWQGGINTTVYKLYSGTSSDNLAYVSDVALNTAYYQFTNLTANTTYYWRVDAIGNAGTTTGNVWSFTTSAFPLGLVADYRFDATTGTDITDNTTYANNGSLINITDYAWEAGKVNNSLNLKTVNSNSAIRMPHANQVKFDKNSFSISMWIKGAAPASATTSSYLLHKGTFTRNATTGATGRWYGVEFKNSTIYWNIDDDVVKSTASMSSSTFLNNSWVHVVFVRDVPNRKLLIYKNGALATSATETTGTTNGIGSTDPLVIANTTLLDAPFKGAVDEVKIYNYALSTTEISNLYTVNTVLPVTLTRFDAKAENNSVKLSWTTASEQNNDHFVIERSADGTNFSVLTAVKGKGSSTVFNTYNAFDIAPVNGMNYYRLSQVDIDGKTTVLGIASAKFSVEGPAKFAVYPNPLNTDVLNLKVPDFKGNNITVSLTSIDGRRVLTEKAVQTDALNQIYSLQLKSKLAAGQYVLQVAADGLKESKIVLVK